MEILFFINFMGENHFHLLDPALVKLPFFLIFELLDFLQQLKLVELVLVVLDHELVDWLFQRRMETMDEVLDLFGVDVFKLFKVFDHAELGDQNFVHVRVRLNEFDYIVEENAQKKENLLVGRLIGVIDEVHVNQFN